MHWFLTIVKKNKQTHTYMHTHTHTHIYSTFVYLLWYWFCFVVYMFFSYKVHFKTYLNYIWWPSTSLIFKCIVLHEIVQAYMQEDLSEASSLQLVGTRTTENGDWHVWDLKTLCKDLVNATPIKTIVIRAFISSCS